jgi:hypothetical protein
MIMKNKKKEFTYADLEEMEELIESSDLRSEQWKEQSSDFVYNTMPSLISQLRLYMKCNEELQSLDGMQQMAIERLNKEINLLRESLHMLEQKYKLMLVQQTST